MWLDHLVLRAVARDPKQRFETAEEMVLALERQGFIRRQPATARSIELLVDPKCLPELEPQV